MVHRKSPTVTSTVSHMHGTAGGVLRRLTSQPTHHLFAQSTYGISAYRQYRPYTTTRQHSSAAFLSRAPEFEFTPTRLLEND